MTRGESAQTAHRASVLWFAVPVVAGAAGAFGWSRVRELQGTGLSPDPQLAVAMVAAGACLAVAGWWLGGLLMLGLATLARAARWAPLERWASRLTPGIVARTAAALVGAQLIAVVPAHADDAAPDPFWSPAAPGTQQLAPVTEGGDGASSDTGVAADAGEVSPGSSPTSGSVVGHGGDPGAGDKPGVPGGAGASPSTDHSADPAGTPSPADPALAPAPADRPAEHSDPEGHHHGRVAVPAAKDRVVDGALTVVSGDTLWDLTAQLLGPGATDETVCGQLPSWLQHNTLAEHGDLIRPGDVLRVPPELLDAAGSAR